MTLQSKVSSWFESVKELPVPKFITGLRGTGKTRFLLGFRDRLLAEGVPAGNLLFIDAEAPEMRAFATHEQMIEHVLSSLPSDGKSCVFIREAAALPDAEIVVGTLAASARRMVYATSSSRRLLGQGLARYFSTRLAHFKVLPADAASPYESAAAIARWNEIFLNDVLAPNRILEVSLSCRIAGWLSDNLGDPLSLRTISAAISPANRMLSPHTIDAYLSALEDANLVEKAMRWDTAEEAPQKTNYKYFFTDPWLRLARFGPAPAHEGWRMALNRAWLKLRHDNAEVFTASGTPGVHFVTHGGRSGFVRWRVADGGALERVD